LGALCNRPGRVWATGSPHVTLLPASIEPPNWYWFGVAFHCHHPGGLAPRAAVPSVAIIASETIKRAGYSLLSCSRRDVRLTMSSIAVNSLRRGEPTLPVMAEPICSPMPSAGVLAWTRSDPVSMPFATAITEAELLYGIALQPSAWRRRSLKEVVDLIFAEDLAGRVLPFDNAAAHDFSGEQVAGCVAPPPMHAVLATLRQNGSGPRSPTSRSRSRSRIWRRTARRPRR